MSRNGVRPGAKGGAAEPGRDAALLRAAGQAHGRRRRQRLCGARRATPQSVCRRSVLRAVLRPAHAEPVGKAVLARFRRRRLVRSEEHTSELQSLMRISYAVLCLKNKKINT